MTIKNIPAQPSRVQPALAAVPPALKPAALSKHDFVGSGGKMTMAEWNALSSDQKFARLGRCCPG